MCKQSFVEGPLDKIKVAGKSFMLFPGEVRPSLTKHWKFTSHPHNRPASLALLFRFNTINDALQK